MSASTRATNRIRRRVELLGGVALLLCLAATAGTVSAQGMSEEDEVFYFLGIASARNLDRFELSSEEVEMVKRGFADALAGEAKEVDPQALSMKAQEIMQERMGEAAAEEKKLAAAFLAEEAKKPGARTTDSGIVITTIEEGSGASPTREDTVVAHYHGTLRDGTVFDSSVDRGQPFRTQLSRVVPCWQEAISTMKEGGKARIVCPADLAYGDAGSPPKIKGGAALAFEVELIEGVD